MRHCSHRGIRIASPAFYALGESRTPVIISFVTVLANAALNFAFVEAMGYRGLALGTSIAALLNAGLLLVMLRRRLGGIEGGAIASALARIAVAAALMGAAAAGTNVFLSARLPGDGLAAQLVRVGTTIGIALAVLAVSAHLLRVPQFSEAVSLITRRLRRLRP